MDLRVHYFSCALKCERALCTDNGAMVAMLGVNLVEAGVHPSPLDFPIDSAMPLTRISM